MYFIRRLRSQDLSQQQLDDIESDLVRDSVLPILRLFIRQGVEEFDGNSEEVPCVKDDLLEEVSSATPPPSTPPG
jgi:hypothetical protein